MIKEIIKLGNPLLQRKSELLDSKNVQESITVWNDLEDTLKDVMSSYTFKRSAGISAVQIGYMKRACIIWTPSMGFRFLANPVVKFQSEVESKQFEGCLSFFDKRGCVPRPIAVEVLYLDRRFQPCEERFEGEVARIFLHELDHMNGILYTDRMEQGEQLFSKEQYLQMTATN